MTVACFEADAWQLSNIADRGYLGLAASLNTFGPLLKRKKQNPNAIFLTLFLNAVHEVLSPLDSLGFMISEMKRLQRYMAFDNSTVQQSTSHNADFLRSNEARAMFRDFDGLFERYMRECRFDQTSEAAGMKMSSSHAVVRPWPLRLKKNASQQEFDLLHASSHNGSERYVEWMSAS